MWFCVELYTATGTSVGGARLPLREGEGKQQRAVWLAVLWSYIIRLIIAATRHRRLFIFCVIRRVSEMAAFLISILCTFCLKSYLGNEHTALTSDHHA